MPKLKDDTEFKKMFYKMGEASKIIGVAPSLLRFWEKEFTCLKDLQKNRKGDRLYTEKIIILFIYFTLVFLFNFYIDFSFLFFSF